MSTKTNTAIADYLLNVSVAYDRHRQFLGAGENPDPTKEEKMEIVKRWGVALDRAFLADLWSDEGIGSQEVVEVFNYPETFIKTTQAFLSEEYWDAIKEDVYMAMDHLIHLEQVDRGGIRHVY